MPLNDHQNVEKNSNEEMGDITKKVDKNVPEIKSQLTETFKEEKIYGKYPGSLDKEFIDEWCKSNDIYSEIQIFLKYEDIDLACHQQNHLYPSSRRLISQTSESEKYNEELTYAKYFLIAQTEKFGVNIEKAKNWEGIMRWSSFMKWYDYRKDFFDSLDNSSNENAQLFASAYKERKDLSRFLPPKPEKW